MVHLRIVSPAEQAEEVTALLARTPAACNLVTLKGAAKKPDGDVIMADVAREDASVVIDDLRELGIPERGSIAVEEIDTAISDAAERAVEEAEGLPSDAVVWEEVEARTSENTELSSSFLLFMVIAMQIAAIGIVLDQPILIVGAMVVGPEFGPLAGLSVALVELKGGLARRSLVALLAGFPLGIAVTVGASLLFVALGVFPEAFARQPHPFTDFISQPDVTSFILAYLAGTAGVLSLTSAKSGALIGVLISVTTIPSAANIGVGAAYGDWPESAGALLQLSINLSTIVLAGIVTLFVQRRLYLARRRRHLDDPARRRAGLPLGRSRRSTAMNPSSPGGGADSPGGSSGGGDREGGGAAPSKDGDRWRSGRRQSSLRPR